MLRKRSRATASNQASMSDYGSVPSPTDKYRSIASSFFSSPRLFASFTSKGFITDTESIKSPTSTLDSRGLSSFKNPFWSDTPTTKTPKPESRNLWEKLDSRCVGLGLIDALADDKSDKKFSKPESRMVVFGSQLKIQIPPLPTSVLLSPSDSPKSPKDFGIKTRNFQLGSFSTCLSPSPVKKTPFGSSNSGMENLNSPRVFHGCLSASEMGSEDYTCVITYGPNPRTTHIFEDCIVESCPGVGLSASRKENELFTNRSRNYPPENFLSFCFKCKKNLDQGKDVYMYMGDKAFCSSECRYKEMMLEEGMGKLESDDVYGFSS